MQIEWQPDEDNVYLTSGNDNLAIHRVPKTERERATQLLDHIGFFVQKPEDVDQWFLFLKENNYRGFVICDDIWYFNEMRNNFWYKIEDEFKYDLTDLGHWSGTGVVFFGS